MIKGLFMTVFFVALAVAFILFWWIMIPALLLYILGKGLFEYVKSI